MRAGGCDGTYVLRRPGAKSIIPNHHRVMLALSTAFWYTYLRDDVSAKKWLNGDGPESLLEKGDKLRKK